MREREREREREKKWIQILGHVYMTNNTSNEKSEKYR